MANKVTGSTDTSGALTTSPTSPKSILIVGKQTTVVNEGDTQALADLQKPNVIFDITGTADAINKFGSNSIVSKMVRVMIAGGVDNIKGIVTDSKSESAYADALEVSLADPTIKVVVADNNDANTVSAVKDHLAVAEANDKFRYSVFAPSADDVKSQVELVAYAKTIDCDRIFIPGAVLLQNDINADPQVTASGLASAIMAETDDPALPLNGVELKGFDGMSRVMLEAEMKVLAESGITPVYLEGTSPAIYRLVTSKLDDKVWQEGTVRFVADYVLESNENLLRANYKRTKNVARILDSIKGDTDINMQNIERLEIIENWDSSTLTVTKDPKDNFGALVDYEFDVVTPLYTITITQHMKI